MSSPIRGAASDPPVSDYPPSLQTPSAEYPESPASSSIPDTPSPPASQFSEHDSQEPIYLPSMGTDEVKQECIATLELLKRLRPNSQKSRRIASKLSGELISLGSKIDEMNKDLDGMNKYYVETQRKHSHFAWHAVLLEQQITHLTRKLRMLQELVPPAQG